MKNQIKLIINRELSPRLVASNLWLCGQICKAINDDTFYLKKILAFHSKVGHQAARPQYEKVFICVWSPALFTWAGGTPLYGLNRDVRPDRVWFSEGFVSLERGVDFINFCLKQGIVTRPYVFINLQKPHKKPNFYQFANVQHIEMRNSLWLIHSSRKEVMMLA